MNLFLALCAEHKQRTEHDIFTQGVFDITHINCDVCLFLSSERRRLEVERTDFLASLQQQNKK